MAVAVDCVLRDAGLRPASQHEDRFGSSMLDLPHAEEARVMAVAVNCVLRDAGLRPAPQHEDRLGSSMLGLPHAEEPASAGVSKHAQPFLRSAGGVI
jgi:hypothetical protein